MKQVLAMLAHAADGAMLVDETGTVVFWNRTAQRMLGYRPQEVVGRPCHEVFRGETLDGLPLCSPACGIRQTLACGRGVHTFDMRTHTKAGRKIWLNISSLPVPSRKKGRFLAAHVFRDITKQARVRRLAEDLHAALCVPERPAGLPTGVTPAVVTRRGAGPDALSSFPLSEREREVLRLLAAGWRTKDMAEALGISPATVRNHIQHILEKLGAHTRLQALAIAFHPGGRSSS